MLLINCPYCDDALPELEFAYAGEAHIARPADPSKMCRAAKPIRSIPAENIGLADSAPPDGFTLVEPGRPIASARINC